MLISVDNEDAKMAEEAEEQAESALNLILSTVE